MAVPTGNERISVCLGFPAYHRPQHLERLRAVDPRIDPVPLPVDPGGGWVAAPPADPHEEPPAWAVGVAEERRRALAQAEALIALHTPRDLMSLAPRLRWIQGLGAGVEQFLLTYSCSSSRVRRTSSVAQATSLWTCLFSVRFLARRTASGAASSTM